MAKQETQLRPNPVLHAATTTSTLLRSTYGLYCTLSWTRSTRVSPQNAAIVKRPGILANDVHSILGWRPWKHNALANCPQARHRGSLPRKRRGSHASFLFEGQSLQRCASVSLSYADSIRSSFPLRVLLQEPPFRCSQVWLLSQHSGLVLIPFTEENIRIVNSKVHPLDSSSTPYAFSSSAVPLLHRTARALNLPARSSKSYYAFLGIPPPPISSPSEMGPRRTGNSAPLPVTVTGTFELMNSSSH